MQLNANAMVNWQLIIHAMLNACPQQKDAGRATSRKVMVLYRFLSKRLWLEGKGAAASSLLALQHEPLENLQGGIF